ncbi:MAG: ASKHA domain-containing protein, partial [Bacillota bacterium]|nr:ASKHA domain-containing protein [Bacillota bacterium]
KRVFVTLDEPTLTENGADLPKLMSELRKRNLHNVQIGLENLRALPEVLRAGSWQATVTVVEIDGQQRIVSIEPGHVKAPLLGLAIDIGTTTVVVNLVNIETGEIIDSQGSYNKQARYGDDVITRIVHATDEEKGLADLQQAVLNTINELVDKLLTANNLEVDQLKAAVVAGNTTMTQLFLGINPKYIRLEPYIPTVAQVPIIKASELGLRLNSEAIIYNFPAVASYVGGDIVSGVLATNMAKEDAVVLFIDIGTNGEMVLGNQDWLVTCACSAGPAFEGGGITFGTRAMTGAIERVIIEPNSFEVELKTIGNGKPMGICGSGLIDGLSKLRNAGLIDRSGKFNQNIDSNRLRRTDEDWEFVLAWADDTELGKDIVLTESDIKNIIRAKGAIYSGIRTMLKMMELDGYAIEKIIIAGGFGNFLNISDAIQIGLLPDLPLDKYLFLGNSSVKGAKIALLSKEALLEAEEVGRKMTYLELSVGNAFMDEFVSALFLPHTDLSQFPSVKQ